MKRQRVWIVAAILMLTAALLLSGCGDGASQQQPRGEASIEDIAVKTNPKTDYVLGDDFSIQGGELTLYYDDGTTKTLAFTEDGVHVSAPDMGTVGSKTVTVEYDGFTASYMITLETKKVQVTLDLNYEGAPAAEKLSVPAGDCLVVENTEAGVEAAKAAGMRVAALGEAVGSPYATLADLHLPERIAQWEEREP